MTLAANPSKYTPEDLLKRDDAVSYELIDGELLERQVSRESSRVTAIILRLLANEAARTGEAEVYPPDLGYRCFRDPNEIRKPDVSVIRRERLDQLERSNPGYMPIAPDLAVEVLSPSDLAYQVDWKLKVYMEAGVKLIWLVNPDTHSLVAYTSEGRIHLLRETDEITAAPALLNFRCRVDAFFKS